MPTLCPCVNKPHGCCGNNGADVAANLRAALGPLAGRLVAVLAEAEDGQHVSPLLPPQGVSFVERRELAADEDGDVSLACLVAHITNAIMLTAPDEPGWGGATILLMSWT